MSRRSRESLMVAVLIVAGASVACSTETPVAPAATHNMTHMSATVATVTVLDPFTFRATLDPYRLHQLPDFMIHSNTRTDIVLQRLVFQPGAGAWHTHPGPSFVYVIEGEIRLDRYTDKEGCSQTPVSVAGAAYYEVADQVHRAVVVSAQPAVLLVTRFNIPVGGAITVPAADPGC